jgi:carbamoyltransferase
MAISERIVGWGGKEWRNAPVILGLSGGHDANWCVWQGGGILGAFEKERFTRRRHDGGEVASLVAPTLDFLGLSVSDIDIIVTSEPVHREGFEPGARRVAGRRYESLMDWQWQCVTCMDRYYACLSVPHHLAHAAYAYYSSPFQECAVITWDGGGDGYTVDAYAATSVSYWRDGRLSWIERVENCDLGSLWFMYANAIFGDGHAAGKLMGLAALGTDHLVEPMYDRVLMPAKSLLGGALTVKSCWPDFDRPPFVHGRIGWRDPAARDIAFAVQAATTKAGVSIASALGKATGCGNLALGGGVALNGYLNTAVASRAGFEATFVPPAVNDAGIACGAALFAAHHELRLEFDPYATRTLDFLGCAYSHDRCRRAVEHANLVYRNVDRDEAVLFAAQVIEQGKIVAWYEGRSEHGPRALGNRSIFSSAGDGRFRQRINAEIKFREPFRPVAPAVLLEDAPQYFNLMQPSPYMMYIVDAIDRTRASAPAAVHVDGTARVQTVPRSSPFGQLITAVYEKTGIPMIINTSLNVRSPIVETPEDAVHVFVESPIDVLYLEGMMVER